MTHHNPRRLRFNANETRKNFPILDKKVNGLPLVYLDNAATTQKPVSVINALNHYYRAQNANVHRASHHLGEQATHAFEAARNVIKDFIGAENPAEIIWTRGTTEAINLVANSYGKSVLKENDEIILTTLEHHANIVPWQMVAEQTGAIIKVAAINNHCELDLAHFESLLSNKTRIVSIGHVSNALGTTNPVRYLTEKAHEAGAVVLVDGAQAVGHYKVNVSELDCDFYAFSGHKMYGPTGIGVLYGKEALLEAMPPWQGGGEMIERVSFEKTTFNQLPFKFEAGTPGIASAIGLAKAAEFISQYDRDEVLAHEANLLNKALALAETIEGLKRVGTASEHIAILSFLIDRHHPQDIGTLLDRQGIAVRTGHHCAMPLMEHLGINGTIRTSFSLYNTEQEVEALFRALHRIVELPANYTALSDPPSQPGAPATREASTATILSYSAVEKELLEIRSWEKRYRYIMQLGKALTDFSEDKKTDKYLVPGCETRTWVDYNYNRDNGRLVFKAYSEARIIRGLIAILLSIANDSTAADISDLDFNAHFEKLDLLRHLSPSRGNGLRAIAERVKSVAAQYTPPK